MHCALPGFLYYPCSHHFKRFRISIVNINTLKLISLSIFLFTFVLAGCSFYSVPARALPARSNFVEFVSAPNLLDTNEIGIFSIRTSHGNKCFGTIFYDEVGNSKVVHENLPTIDADTKGLCTWEWDVPLNAKAGNAVFKASVEKDRLHDSILPYTFCIQQCPWGLPTVHP